MCIHIYIRARGKIRHFIPVYSWIYVLYMVPHVYITPLTKYTLYIGVCFFLGGLGSMVFYFGTKAYLLLTGIYVYIYVYIYTYIYVYIYIYTCVHSYSYMFVYVYINIYIYMYVYMYICVYVYGILFRNEGVPPADRSL
jgi:hypothetical protein